MNKKIMQLAGFAKEVKLAEDGQCPLCQKKVTAGSFRDEPSLREWHISGLCQDCQDEIFGE